MSFSARTNADGVVIVEVSGQLVVVNRQEFKQVVLDAIENDSNRFVVDFSNTEYIDSSGLGVLVSLAKKVSEKEGDIKLVGLNEDLTTLFELTKLDSLFTITATVEDALSES